MIFEHDKNRNGWNLFIENEDLKKRVLSEVVFKIVDIISLKISKEFLEKYGGKIIKDVKIKDIHKRVMNIVNENLTQKMIGDKIQVIVSKLK